MRRVTVAGWIFAGMLAFTATACSDGPAEQEADDTGLRPIEESPDGADTTEPDASRVDTGRGAGEPDTSADDQDDSECDGRVCDNCVACRFKQPDERTCQTDGDDRPARCEDNPAEFAAWGPGSVLTHLEITSENARNCCFNIDGSKNRSPDNQLGQVAAALPFDVDREIKERLATEDFATLMEHADLRDLEGTQSFDSNVYVGYFANADTGDYLRNVEEGCNLATEDCTTEASSGKEFLVSPESFDQGTHPQVQFHPAELDDGDYEAGPSRLVLDFGVRGIGALVLRIYGATIEADVDTLESDVDGDGVVIDNGKLGGYVLLKDIVDLVNNLLEPCDCLDNPPKAIQYPGTSEGDPDLFPDECVTGDAPAGECELTCAEMVEQQADQCGGSSGLVCEDAGQICSFIGGLPDLADLDSDNDGQIDALSIGAIFEMKGARIAGVADYVKMPDQQYRGGVRLDRVFTNEPGWVVVYGERSQSEESIVGYERVEPGNHTDLTVEMSAEDWENYLSNLRVVLHRDDGPQSGTFEPAEDSKAKRHPDMSGFVSDGSEIWLE
jgi:hypothetical protein